MIRVPLDISPSSLDYNVFLITSLKYERLWGGLGWKFSVCTRKRPISNSYQLIDLSVGNIKAYSSICLLHPLERNGNIFRAPSFGKRDSSLRERFAENSVIVS